MSSKNVELKVTTHDDGQFVRTAVQLNENCSMDILNRDGKLIARINIYDSNDYTDVDVCRPDDLKGITTLAWAKGVQVMNQTLEDSSIVAVLLLKKEKNK